MIDSMDSAQSPINDFQTLLDYCEQTSVHGFFYWGSGPLLQRLVWVAAVVAAFTFTGLFLSGIKST